MGENQKNAQRNSFKSNQSTESYVHHLVWLDKNIENNAIKQNLSELRELDDKLKLFSNPDECIDYIKKQNDGNAKSYIILIISGSFSEQILPKIHDYACILAIFLHSNNSERFQSSKFSKLRAICTDTHELFDRIRNCMNRDMIPMGFSLFNNRSTAESGKFILKYFETNHQYNFLFFENFIELKYHHQKKNQLKNIRFKI